MVEDYTIMRREKNTICIASKISRTNADKLRTIADNLGVTTYALLQGAILTLVRYFDTGSVLSAEHRSFMQTFATVLRSTIASHNPMSRRNSKADKVTGAVLFIERKAGATPQPLLVSLNNGATFTESYNIDTMLTALLEATDREALERLQDEQKRQGLFSIAATLHDLIMATTSDSDQMHEDVEDLFKDIRIATGHKINDDVYYQRHHRTIDYSSFTPMSNYQRGDI